jgi:type II secretory pathway component PulJ
MPRPSCCPMVWPHLAMQCHKREPRTVATQSLNSVIQNPERRYAEVDRLDDLDAFLTIIEKSSQAAASRHLRRPLSAFLLVQAAASTDPTTLSAVQH